MAVGDNMLAVGWIHNNDVFVALARGGNHFQLRRVDSGSRVSLAFSTANRLHLAYEQDESILYRAGDQWFPTFLAYGSNAAVIPFYNRRRLSWPSGRFGGLLDGALLFARADGGWGGGSCGGPPAGFPRRTSSCTACAEKRTRPV